MKAIETHFLGQTHSKPARVVASDLDNNRVVIPFAGGIGEVPHRLAAETLKKKMGWTGRIIGGATKNGYTFVFLPERG